MNVQSFSICAMNVCICRQHGTTLSILSVLSRTTAVSRHWGGRRSGRVAAVVYRSWWICCKRRKMMHLMWGSLQRGRRGQPTVEQLKSSNVWPQSTSDSSIEALLLYTPWHPVTVQTVTSCSKYRQVLQIVPGSSVGIATGYGLDGPEIESRGGGGARFSSPVQTGPGGHSASCTMGTGSFPEVKSGRGVTLTPHPLLLPWSRKGRAIPLLPLWVVRPVQSLSACTRVHCTFFTPDNSDCCLTCHAPLGRLPQMKLSDINYSK